MYLGIDPGIRKLGYALVDEDNNIVDAGILLYEKPKANRKQSFERFVEIYNFFDELLKNFSVKNCGIEKLFFTKYNQANAEFVYWVRGLLILLLMQNGVNYCEISPIELKKYITWNSKANKELVKKYISWIFGLKDGIEYSDTADALGLAFVSKRLS